MTLLLKRNPTLPTVAMQTYFKGGIRVETPATNGLSQLTANLLLKGTTSRSAEAIASIFDARGATVVAESGNNSFFVNATCLREDFDELFQVYADIILHPSFRFSKLLETAMLRLTISSGCIRALRCRLFIR